MDDQAFVDEIEDALTVMEPEDPRITQRRLMEAAMPIVQRLSALASETVSKRSQIEQRWIEDMCQYAGVRSVNELAGGKGDPLQNAVSAANSGESSVFVNITRAKTNRTEGKLCDILFPADDRNWGIKPTPVPELSTVAKRAMEEAERAVQEANRLERQGEGATTPGGETPADLLKKAQDLGPQAASAQKQIDEAERRSQRMESEIEDQLVEGRYAQKARDAIGWACKIGIGVIKGPVIIDSGARKWAKGEKGYALQMNAAMPRPRPDCISPWSFFPDPNATSMEDAEFVLERHIASRRDLKRMAKQHSFFPEPVAELLRNGPEHGSPDSIDHLAQIRALTGETTPVSDRYVIWEYHGALTGEEIADLLRAYDPEASADRIEDMTGEMDLGEERMVIVHFCNGKLLKISEYYPMDSGDFIYSVFSLEKGQASILGAIGIPRIMRDPQEVVNAAWRMMMDNAALAVASQVVVDMKTVKPLDGDWTLRPKKVWLFDSDNGGASPFQTFAIPMNQEAIAGIIGLARQFIDDETSMPSIAEGMGNEEQAPGVASTVGGFAMLLNAAGVNIRRMVKNWDDDVTSGLIRRFYDWNMQMSDRDEIKGDMSVDARGTSVLLVRETQAPNLMAITTQWSTHPVLGAMLKPYGMARKTMQAMAIDPNDVLIEEEEYQKRIAEMASQEEQPADPQWEVRERIAQLDAQTKIRVAEMEREIQIMRLAEESKRTIAEIQADLQKASMAEQSKERTLAVEVASEERAAREARAIGRIPDGSGGAISLGSEAP